MEDVLEIKMLKTQPLSKSVIMQTTTKNGESGWIGFSSFWGKKVYLANGKMGDNW